jgi:hypothetical protein
MMDSRAVNQFQLYLKLFKLFLSSTSTITNLLIGFPRPNFVTGGFFNGKNVDGLYTRNTQRQTISTIVGSYELANKYIEDTSDVFLGENFI